MQRTLIKDVREEVGHSVMVRGFVHVVRNQKAVQFIILRDHTGMIQIAMERSKKNSAINELVATLTRESAIEVIGMVFGNPAVKLGQIEIQLESLKVISMADAVLPIDTTGKTESEADKRLDWRFLDLRSRENQLVFQVQTTVEAAMRDFWLSHGFVEIHTPKLMGSPSEGGAELFTLDYFGQTASLAQSPQFYKQMAIAAGMDRVFEIGPVFRADPSFTPRHATEFTSVDMEMAWIESHYEIMEFEELWLKHVLKAVKENHSEEIKESFGVEVAEPALPFPKVTMQEAQEILGSLGYIPSKQLVGELGLRHFFTAKHAKIAKKALKTSRSWRSWRFQGAFCATKHFSPTDCKETKKGDIDPQGERLLCEYAREKYGHEFIFIIDYPEDIRPFYHMRYEDKPAVTKSFDLLWKWMEITTGSQREHRYDVLAQHASEKGIKLETIQFYLDFFKFGCPPHGGFGFGLARLLAAMLNRKSIRDVTFLHRGPNRLIP